MSQRVAVIGAGLSGLAAAEQLQSAGMDVTVFDKGRRPGGRANTREHGLHRFDHGAQFFTVRDPRTRSLLEDWLARGVAARWDGRLVRITGTSREPATEAERFVGTPGMIALAEDLSVGLDVRAGVRVATLAEGSERWTLRDDEGREVGDFDFVIVAVPAPQAAELLASADELRRHAASAEMRPCWAVMSVFSEPLSLDFDGAFVREASVSWVARDASKPGRPSGERWVFHATPEWTAAHWDEPRESVGPLLRAALEETLGELPPVTFERAHRWAYALSSASAPGVAFDSTARIGVCGDWCVGGRVEGALVSGWELAGRILGEPTARARR